LQRSPALWLLPCARPLPGGGVRPPAEPRGPARLLILTVGCAPDLRRFHQQQGARHLRTCSSAWPWQPDTRSAKRSIVAARVLSTRDSRWTVERLTAVSAWIFILGYGAAGVAYYEKWYASAGKASWCRTRRQPPRCARSFRPVPNICSPLRNSGRHFTTSLARTFYSYAASWPIGSTSTTTLAGVSGDRPIFLIVDEYQWLQELTGMTSSTSDGSGRGWISSSVDACSTASRMGPRTARSRCFAAARRRRRPPGRRASSAAPDSYSMAERVLNQGVADLAHWPRYQDPRTTAGARPEVRPPENGLRIEGSGWPGIVKLCRGVLPESSYPRKSRHAGHA